MIEGMAHKQAWFLQDDMFKQLELSKSEVQSIDKGSASSGHTKPCASGISSKKRLTSRQGGSSASHASPAKASPDTYLGPEGQSAHMPSAIHYHEEHMSMRQWKPDDGSLHGSDCLIRRAYPIMHLDQGLMPHLLYRP